VQLWSVLLCSQFIRHLGFLNCAVGIPSAAIGWQPVGGIKLAPKIQSHAHS
jgi:hypothetical protein